MKRGRKPELPAEKRARGTFQKCRDAGKEIEILAPGEIAGPSDLPQMPEWLTVDGQMVWQDDVGRVAAGKLVTERDATMFGNYCNLQGALIAAWREVAKGGEAPPAAHLSECRKMAEQFGIFGAKSRMKVADNGGKNSNPFARNGRR